jgi:hypothetical protein
MEGEVLQDVNKAGGLMHYLYVGKRSLMTRSFRTLEQARLETLIFI